RSSALDLRPRLTRGFQDRDLLPQLVEFAFELTDARAHRVAILSAWRPVGDEAGTIVHGIDGNGLRRNADDSGTWRDVPGDDSVGANTRALADLDRPQHLRARANDHAVV